MSNGKVFKHTLKYDGRVKIDKTLFRTDCVEHRARESRRVSESLIKTWVDTQNDDNSRYYIPINSPPTVGIHLKITQNVLFIMFCLSILV